MQVRFKLNGQEVKGGNLQASIEEVAFHQAKERLRARIASVRCPEHNRAPQLKFEGNSLNTVKIRIQSCCKRSRNHALAALEAK
jgi:hypothetical protein